MLRRLLGLGRGQSAEEDAAQYLEPRSGHPLIRLQELSKTYPGGEEDTIALEKVDLEITRGEFVTVSGPSGCGKSTLLHLIGLLESPSSGRYFLNGHEVAGLKPSLLAHLRNKTVGFIFQNFNLIGDLTVFENVETPLTYLGLSKSERHERVADALGRVGMEHYARRYPSQITGGEQQRAAVARAVVGDPLILLADEPTGNLDSSNGEKVMGLLQELHAKGATLLLVTHNPDYAQRAQRNLPLFDGRLAGPDRPDRRDGHSLGQSRG